MVTKVIIKNNKKSPIHYLNELKTFKNGKEYVFKEGVNIVMKAKYSPSTNIKKGSYIVLGTL